MLPAPRRTAPPAALPVSLLEFKLARRIDDADEDAFLGGLLAAATDHLDGWRGLLGRCIVSQGWEARFPGWRPTLCLPFPDVQSAQVSFRAADGAENMLPADAFDLIEMPRGSALRFRPAADLPPLSGDEPFPVSVAMVAGYGAPGEVPRDIRRAIVMLAGHWDVQREAQEVPEAVLALVAHHRVRRL